MTTQMNTLAGLKRRGVNATEQCFYTWPLRGLKLFNSGKMRVLKDRAVLCRLVSCVPPFGSRFEEVGSRESGVSKNTHTLSNIKIVP
jgi:hypothetical protein